MNFYSLIFLIISILIASILLLIYIIKYYGLGKDKYNPTAVWIRAFIYFSLCNIFSIAMGTSSTLLSQPIARIEQVTNPIWLSLLIFCFVFIFIAYWILWARMTLTFDRKFYIGMEIVFGFAWGLSMGQILLSFFHLWNLTNIPPWAIYICSFTSMGFYQYFIQDYFWDLYISPEHDTPKSIKIKTFCCHIPNITICLLFLTLYENYLLFIIFQTFALIGTAIFQKFPAPWAKGEFNAPMSEPGIFGFPHATGYIKEQNVNRNHKK
ncbi:MAG: hypothetical protein GF329_12335 [Candidatus Lokiarchaeota archaeon]|nr:hypothetical protein [Candidatus Lokiarchaeota archaeon]